MIVSAPLSKTPALSAFVIGGMVTLDPFDYFAVFETNRSPDFNERHAHILKFIHSGARDL
jgi:hypothetical protein